MPDDLKMSILLLVKKLGPSGCNILTNPLNGHITHQGTGIGAIGNYECDSGYSLNGDSQRICTFEGSWSGNAPTCSSGCKLYIGS